MTIKEKKQGMPQICFIKKIEFQYYSVLVKKLETSKQILNVIL